MASGFDDAYKQLNQTPEMKLINTTQEQIDVFANSGLRTLMVAWRSVELNVFTEWKASVDAAREILDDDHREAKMDELNNQIESRLELLGATAIEDKLQVFVSWAPSADYIL